MITNDPNLKIDGSVGANGKNNSTDTYKVQLLLNRARSQFGAPPIVWDGDVGSESIGAIRDFQKKCFGRADGRVDPAGRSFKHLVQIYSEPSLVSPKTYTRGLNQMYKVTVGIDGRIFVKPGDTLSKYSAAINNNYYQVYLFARIVDGRLSAIKNYDLIRAGEILYYLPTWSSYLNGKTNIKMPPIIELSPKEKEKISQDAIKGDFKLKGDYGFKIADGIGTALDYASPVVDVIAMFLEKLGPLADGLAIIGVVFQTYGNFRDFLNVSDLDLRLYGMRAAAYATTAWAFKKVIPNKSVEMRLGYQQSFTYDPQKMQQLDEIWRISAQAAVESQERWARENFCPTLTPEKRKACWQEVLRKLGDDSPVKLCIEIMKSLKEPGLQNAIGSTRRSINEMWELGYKITYDS